MPFTIVNFILYQACKHFGECGLKTDNQYTIRHTEFNLLIFSFYYKYFLFLLLGIVTQRNMGIRFNNRCLDYPLTLLFILMRFAAVCYLMRYIIPDFALFIFKCYHLNEDNWWVNAEEENFITNCSSFNAFFAWFNWIPWIIFIIGAKYLGILIGSFIMIIVLAAILVKPSELTNAMPKICHALRVLFSGLWTIFKNFLLGLVYDEAAEWQRRLNQSSDDYQREQAHHR